MDAADDPGGDLSAPPSPTIPDCPGCPGELLELSQPDVHAPELVVGHCAGCGALYLVEEVPLDSGLWRVRGRAGLLSAG